MNPQFRSDYTYAQDGTAYSIFGQAQVNLLPTLELSVGARYSYEKKRLTDFRATAANRNLIGVDVDRDLSFNNLSPEFTLSYRPSDRLTVYGSYKEGFLSGGFDATVPAVSSLNAATGRYTSLTDPRYDQQLIRGFEGGIKAALLDNALRLNLAAYSYRTDGLQVAVLVGIQQELRNAGEVRTRGVEFDAADRTPING
ncbi:TonB-dependent receptor domain-containing protein [Sphingomonas sp. MMS24-JH45]